VLSKEGYPKMGVQFRNKHNQRDVFCLLRNYVTTMHGQQDIKLKMGVQVI
jgi:hypothetical protein